MDAISALVRDSVMHKLGVVHPGGSPPRVEIQQGAYDGIMTAFCHGCDWRQTAPKSSMGSWNLKSLQEYLDSATSEALRSGRIEKELLVFYVMSS